MEFKKLQKIIAEVLGIGDMEIFQEMSFVDDLGADSLELFQILMGVEQEFDISIDEESLKDVDTVGDLLYHGLIHMKVNGGYRSRIVEENELVTVRTKTSGILVLKVKCGDHLSVGDEIAEIIDTYEGDVIEVIKSPCEGCLFYHGSNPLIYSNTAIAKIIKDTDFI